MPAAEPLLRGHRRVASRLGEKGGGAEGASAGADASEAKGLAGASGGLAADGPEASARSVRSVSVGILAFEAFCALFAAANAVLGPKISFSGAQGEPYPANFIAPLGIADAAAFAAVAAVAFVVLEAVRRAVAARREASASGRGQENPDAPCGLRAFLRAHRAALLGCWAAVMACWVVVWLNYWPGTSMNDQLAVIGNPIGFANNHPLLYNVAIAGLVRISVALAGTGSYGFAAFILCQMAACAAIVAVCCAWLRCRRVPKAAVAASAAFFCLCPIVVNFAGSALKDVMFAYVLALWIPLLWEAFHRGPSFWGSRFHLACLFGLIAATCLVRNNGLYIAVVLAVAIVAHARRAGMARVVAASALAFVVALVPNAFLSSIGVQQLFRESVGIPLQQLGAVVAIDEASLTDDQLVYLDGIMPIEDIRKAYAPMSVDMLKYAGSFDSAALQASKGEFMRTYIEVGLSRPDIYLRAFLSQTWGYWSVAAYSSDQGYFFRVSDNIRAQSDIQAIEGWGLENRSVYPEGVSGAIDGAMRALIWFPGPAACFALLLAAGYARIVRTGDARDLAVLAPFALLWGTLLIASPLACAFRYALPFATALPFVWALLFAPARRRRRRV